MARRSAQSSVHGLAHSQNAPSDTDGDESHRRVLALSSLLRKPKIKNKELQDFKAKVTTDQQELGALLEQRMRQAEEANTRRRNEFTKSMLDALQTSNRPVQGSVPTLGETKIARNAVFRSVANVLTASEHLVGEYDRLDRMIMGIRDAEPEGVAEAWTEEVESTAKLLKIGAEAAIRNVKKVLGADVEDDGTEETGEKRERMEGVDKMELNYELQKSLQYTERGVRKMVKSLPQDEDH